MWSAADRWERKGDARNDGIGVDTRIPAVWWNDEAQLTLWALERLQKKQPLTAKWIIVMWEKTRWFRKNRVQSQWEWTLWFASHPQSAWFVAKNCAICLRFVCYLWRALRLSMMLEFLEQKKWLHGFCICLAGAAKTQINVHFPAHLAVYISAFDFGTYPFSRGYSQRTHWLLHSTRL